MEFNNEFLERNKTALIEELGETLSFLGNTLDEIINNDPSENSLEEIKSLVIAMSYKLGYATGIFNQFFILSNGFPPEKRKIGFHSLASKKEKVDD